jgi:hypothetical protein
MYIEPAALLIDEPSNPLLFTTNRTILMGASMSYSVATLHQ